MPPVPPDTPMFDTVCVSDDDLDETAMVAAKSARPNASFKGAARPRHDRARVHGYSSAVACLT
eukprot:6620367-Alexandrium_andersonii.AAC.1